MPAFVVYHSWCFCSNVYHSCCTCNPQKGEENTERCSNNRLEDKEKCASCENCRLKNNFGKRLDWPRVFDISGDLAVDHEAQEKCELQVFFVLPPHKKNNPLHGMWDNVSEQSSQSNVCDNRKTSSVQ